ncbi:hypothetical protein OLD77_17225 [Serratia rubidaea]|nr:hypothetical protein [Serratia rubidaea]WBF44367.1 hypothetical protein OLD77_17225 [Serratia rubidaea]
MAILAWYVGKKPRAFQLDCADYTYRLDGKRRLKDYPMEQQASIIADYFYLKKRGYNEWLTKIGDIINFRGVTDKYITHKYEYTLSHFFKQR